MSAALWRAPAPVALPPGYAAGLDVPPLLAELLYRRGHQTPEAARAFLAAALPAQADWPDLAAGVARVRAAVDRGEPIWVYGDYDADGVTATAILTLALRSLGAAPGFYIPDRFSEGYGLNPGAVGRLAAAGARLLLTCDCGTSAVAEADLARELGMDLVITDHHALPPGAAPGTDPTPGRSAAAPGTDPTPGRSAAAPGTDPTPGRGGLPRAAALVNPLLLPSDHPARGLSGAGVAWLFARALLETAGRDPALADQWLELAALGSIADVVPLVGMCRGLVRAGLPRLWAPACPGLQALLQVAGLTGAFDEEDVAFQLVPRLNAAGRLADAKVALRLLLADDAAGARTLARQLNDLNTRRRELSDRVADEAVQLVEAAGGPGRLVALYRPGWPEGVLGLAAGQLCQRWGVPVALLARRHDGVTVTGSARAPAGFPLLEVLGTCAPLLGRWGGHAGAAGFSLPEDAVAALVAQLPAAAAAARPGAAAGERVQAADLLVPLAQASQELYDQLRLLAPFGAGNPAPVCFARGATVLSARPTAGARHLRLILKDGDTTRGAVWFRAGGADLPQGPVDVAYRLDLDRWHGAEHLQLVLEAVQPAAREAPAGAAAPRAEAEWLDRRGAPAFQVAADFPAAAVFAEGAAGREAGALNRFSVRPCTTLVLRTAPPSPRVWAEVLALATPARLVLAWPTAEPGGAPFIRVLLGLLRHSLAHRGGLVSVAELAARSGELEAAVMAALEALAESGFLALVPRGGGRFQVERRGEGPVRLGATAARRRLEDLLKETGAFRRFLARAPVDHLRQAVAP